MKYYKWSSGARPHCASRTSPFLSSALTSWAAVSSSRTGDRKRDSWSARGECECVCVCRELCIDESSLLGSVTERRGNAMPSPCKRSTDGPLTAPDLQISLWRVWGEEQEGVCWRLDDPNRFSPAITSNTTQNSEPCRLVYAIFKRFYICTHTPTNNHTFTHWTASLFPLRGNVYLRGWD